VNAEGKIALAGSRYPFSGFVFPNFRPWVEKVVGINVEDAVARTPQRRPAPPVNNAPFLARVGACCKRMSQEDKDRVFHGHGHTCQEVPEILKSQCPSTCATWNTHRADFREYIGVHGEVCTAGARSRPRCVAWLP
jgi:hypothetical protein